MNAVVIEVEEEVEKEAIAKVLNLFKEFHSELENKVCINCPDVENRCITLETRTLNQALGEFFPLVIKTILLEIVYPYYEQLTSKQDQELTRKKEKRFRKLIRKKMEKILKLFFETEPYRYK